MPTRLQPLADFLAAQPAETASVTLTFPEIEALVGEALPHAASTAQWWVNGPKQAQARVWLDAGWAVTRRSLRTRPPYIIFARGPADTIDRPFASRHP